MSFLRWILFILVCVLFNLCKSVSAACISTTTKPFLVPLANCTIPPNTNFPDGVDSWGVELSIGDQQLCAVPSLVVNNTVITETEICSNDHTSDLAQCISRRGGTFDFQDAASSYRNESVQNLAPDDVWNSFNPPFGGAGNATVQFASDISLRDFPLAIALQGQNLNANQLGLANDSVLLHNLVSNGLSSSMSFGLFAGSQSISKPRDGHIVFGGFDAALLSGPFSNYTMSNTTNAGNRVCSLQVTVVQLILRRPGVTNDIQLLSQGLKMPSCIEPYDNLFRFPSNVLQNFQTSTNFPNDTSLVSPELYVVEPGLYYNTTFNGSLIFTLDNDLEVEIPSYEMAGPLRGIDPNGQRILQNNVTIVNIFNQNAPENTASLGKVFLSQLYLTVNYPLQQFQLAPVVSATDLSSDLRSLDSSVSTDCSASHSVTNSDIGLIVVGCILGVILLAILLCIYKLRPVWNKMRAKASEETPKMMESEGLILANLREQVRDLKERLESLEAGAVRRHELASGHRASDASELPSPNSPISREHTRLPSILDGNRA